MLVTFTSQAGPNLTLFGEVAVQLLKMMGHSGTVPGAIRAQDIPEALEKLQHALGKAADESDSEDDNDDSVSLGKRAYPLIQLFEAAAREDRTVMWEN